MKKVLILLVTTFIMGNSITGQNIDRDPCVAGSFYPDNSAGLRSMIDELLATTGDIKKEEKVRAIIVPHAGYIFSGEVAAAGFAAIRDYKGYDNIFLIGSSHRASFPGASIYHRGDYITPLGKVKVNREIANRLTTNNDHISYLREAHEGEHSNEVQLPFIQSLFGSSVSIIPVIIGTNNIATCELIAQSLKPWFTGNNLFVISSDFSHYPQYNDAVRVDRATADALISGNSLQFLRILRTNMSPGIKGLSTSMCGWTSALTLLELAAGEDNLCFKHIKYLNSGDSPHGDRMSVVGYHAIVLLETSKENTRESKCGEEKLPGSFDLTDYEKQTLITIARQTISGMLEKSTPPQPDNNNLTPLLRQKSGAFVTIYSEGKLRGCMGQFTSDEPLWKVVTDMAFSAAFNDHRFLPVGKKDYKSISIEISVLSPLKKITNIEEITPGKHGVYIRKGLSSGTFLPQVARDKEWTREELLGYVAKDKAQLGWDGWRDAEIFIYETLLFGEQIEK